MRATPAPLAYTGDYRSREVGALHGDKCAPMRLNNRLVD
jgi:hypothetical protein